MTDEQAKLVEALGKVGIGSLCAIALAASMGFQMWMTHTSQAAQMQHMTQIRSLLRESLDHEEKRIELLEEKYENDKRLALVLERILESNQDKGQ